MNIRKRNIAALMLLLVATLFSACARDYEDDIKAAQDDMDALVQADKDLRAYLTQSINEARTRLNQMLETEDATLQGEISTKMNDLKTDISTRMEAIVTRMNTGFAQSEQRAQQKLDALYDELNGAGGVKERLQTKLDQTRQAVLDAQDAHNQELAAALQTYNQKLQGLQTSLGNLSQTIEGLRAQFDALSSVNQQARLNEIEGKVAALEQYGLDQELEALGTLLHQFTAEKYAEMTTSDLEILNGFYADLVNYSSKVIDQYQDFQNDLDQYEQTYNTLHGDFENVSGDLESLDTEFAALDDVLAESQNIDAIEDACDLIDGYESTILGIIGDLESCKDDCENALSDAVEAADLGDDANMYLSVAEAWATGCEERKDDLVAWIEDLQSNYPWWDW